LPLGRISYGLPSQSFLVANIPDTDIWVVVMISTQCVPDPDGRHPRGRHSRLSEATGRKCGKSRTLDPQQLSRCEALWDIGKTSGSDLRTSTGRHPQAVRYDCRVMHFWKITLRVCAIVERHALELTARQTGWCLRRHHPRRNLRRRPICSRRSPKGFVILCMLVDGNLSWHSVMQFGLSYIESKELGRAPGGAV
jgi:hypothetical protein